MRMKLMKKEGCYYFIFSYYKYILQQRHEIVRSLFQHFDSHGSRKGSKS